MTNNYKSYGIRESTKNAHITQILKAHCVPFYELYGEVYADSMIGGTALFEEVINVTNWSKAKLYKWLGY